MNGRRTIVVASDTHGDASVAARMLALCPSPDALVHLGDFSGDAPRIATVLGCPYYAVRGNCERDALAPLERVLTLYGKRFFLTHGHRYRSDLALALRGEQERCDIVLYGHTHLPSLTAHGKLLLLNPGSPVYPRGGSPRSFAVITVENGELDAHIRKV